MSVGTVSRDPGSPPHLPCSTTRRTFGAHTHCETTGLGWEGRKEWGLISRNGLWSVGLSRSPHPSTRPVLRDPILSPTIISNLNLSFYSVVEVNVRPSYGTRVQCRDRCPPTRSFSHTKRGPSGREGAYKTSRENTTPLGRFRRVCRTSSSGVLFKSTPSSREKIKPQKTPD